MTWLGRMFACWLLLFGLGHQAAAEQFIPIDVNGAENTTPASINSEGIIVGYYDYYYEDQDRDKAFQRMPDGSITTFGKGHFDFAGKISDKGWAVGDEDRLAFLHRGAILRRFSISSECVQDTSASDVNNHKSVVGICTTAEFSSHAFLRANGDIRLVFDAPGAGTLRDQGTLAFGISDDGTIVGAFIDSNYVRHGYLRDKSGHFKEFSIPRAKTTSAGRINQHGTIVGSYTDSSDVPHGFLRSRRGDIIPFDAPNAAAPIGTQPSAINNFDVIAGSFGDANSIVHCFLRFKDGTFLEFDFPGATHGSACRDINDSNAVVGVYDDGTAGRGFLRLP